MLDGLAPVLARTTMPDRTAIDKRSPPRRARVLPRPPPIGSRRVLGPSRGGLCRRAGDRHHRRASRRLGRGVPAPGATQRSPGPQSLGHTDQPALQHRRRTRSAAALSASRSTHRPTGPPPVGRNTARSDHRGRGAGLCPARPQGVQVRRRRGPAAVGQLADSSHSATCDRSATTADTQAGSP